MSLLAGCAGGPPATRALEQPADMTAAVQSHIPPGTLIADAQRFMEREGFRCTPTLNGEWGDRTGLDYLYCDRTDGTGSKWVTQRWMIAVVHADGKVTEVLANTGLTGP